MHAHDTNCETCEGDLSRREFLKFGIAGMGIAALGPMALGISPLDELTQAVRAQDAALSGRKPFVTIVNLFGGNDGLNTVVPINLTPYFERRTDIAHKPESLLTMDEGPAKTSAYKLHPALTNIAKLWADGNVAIVNKIGYPKPNKSHFLSQDIWSFGVRGDFSSLNVPRSGWIARFADQHAKTPLGVCSIGRGRPKDFVGGTSNPLLIKSAESFAFGEDRQFRASQPLRDEVLRLFGKTSHADATVDEARASLAQAQTMTLEVADYLAAYKSDIEYPRSRLGQSLQDSSVLLNSGVQTRMFFTGLGGFDTHRGQIDGHQTRLEEVDGAVGAYVADLKRMGLWKHAAIAIISEFGRRCYENGSGGTDHGIGNCLFVIGGGIKGGMYGPDLVEKDLQGEDLPWEVDFRSVYTELIEKHLGCDPAAVFPEKPERTHKLDFVA